jgi:hypothetical protein
MAFARVEDREPPRSERVEHAPRRRDRATKQAHVVAEHRAESAGLEEVALHVDDEQRRRGRLADELVGGGLDRDHVRKDSCIASSGITTVPAVPRRPASASSSAQIVAWAPPSRTKR